MTNLIKKMHDIREVHLLHIRGLYYDMMRERGETV